MINYKTNEKVSIDNRNGTVIIQYNDNAFYGDEIVKEVLEFCTIESKCFDDIVEYICSNYLVTKEECSSDLKSLLNVFINNDIMRKG